jgi:protein regulator of cytokinesis 1
MHSLISLASFLQSEKLSGTLKDQLASIQPQLDELRRKQEMRVQQFTDVKAHIERITREILDSCQADENGAISPSLHEDLSLKRLDEFHAQLQSLQKEKVIQILIQELS